MSSSISDSAKSSLVESLERSYKSWQFMRDDSPGLNSGAAGEAYARLVGSGVLMEFPRKVREELIQEPEISSTPQNDDEIKIDVLVPIYKGEKRYGTFSFRFDTTLEKINKRLEQIKEEVVNADSNVTL
jgi:hypothetical protein